MLENENQNQNSLQYFRNKLFLSILFLALVLGLVAYVPSAIYAFLNNDNHIFLIDTVAILLLYYLAFNKTISLKIKKILFASIFYMLAFSLLIFMGLKGNGAIIVFTPNILITLYSGRKAGLYSIGISVLFYTLYLVYAYYNPEALPLLNDDEFNLMFIVYINNVIFTLFIVFSICYLIDLLHSSLLRQNTLQNKLEEEHEKVLEAKEKAERSDKLKTAFLANMSHEIKTPMYGMLGSLEVLKSYNTNDLEFQEYIRVMETTSQRLSDVISDVVNVSKIKTGLMKTNAQTFNMHDSLEEVLKPFVFISERKKIKIIKNIKTSYRGSFVYSDKEKVEVVLRHILQNAFKYTNEGFVEIGCSKPDKAFFEFYIKDSGIGISINDIQAVFQPFYKVDVENKKALHGSGLGLSLAKSYVEMLGGEINIESKENVGTTVWFTIFSDFGKHSPIRKPYKK